MIIVALVLALPIAFFLLLMLRIKTTKKEHPEWDEEVPYTQEQRDRDAQEAKQVQDTLERLVVYRTLKDSVQEGMDLDQLIEAFCQMNRISVGDVDDLLLETGTYAFTGEKLFYFSLVRQFDFLGDEYVQLHMDVTYRPSLRTALLFTVRWASRTPGDFFDMVKSSLAYRIVKRLPIYKVSIWVGET